MRFTIAIALAAATLAGCDGLGGGADPVTEAEAVKTAEATEADYGSGDINQIARHYAGDTMVFDAGNPAPSSDPKVIRRWTGEFVSMKPGDFTVADRKIQLLGPDAFINSGVASFSVQAGQARPTIGVRFTQVYQRQDDGQWRIVNEHMSMPPGGISASPAR